MKAPFSQLPDTLDGSTGPVADSASGGVGEWIQVHVGLGVETQVKLLLSVLVVMAILLLRRVVVSLVQRRKDDPRARYQWSKGTAYAAFVLGLLFVTQIWLEAIRQLGTFLGLVSAGLAIALRDPVSNLAGWLFILWRTPFELGDRVQIGGHTGDVVDIRLFQFSILEVGNWVAADQSTGRVIHVPNARLFTEPLANYTVEFDFVWQEMPVLITFESNWKKAKRILREIVDDAASDAVEDAREAVKKASRKFLIHYRHVTPTVYTSVEAHGVLLTLRFLCRTRQRRGVTEIIWERILDAFGDAPDIDLAYPTRRVFQNPVEGKPDIRAPVQQQPLRPPQSPPDEEQR